MTGVEGPSEQADDGLREAMYLVRSRTGNDYWTEWDKDRDEIIRAVSERVADQKRSHPGFDVIRVVIDEHIVIRATTSVEVVGFDGWADGPAQPVENGQEHAHG